MSTVDPESELANLPSPEFAEAGGPVAFAFPVANELFDLVCADAIVSQAQGGNSSFVRSTDNTSSFYPKLAILSLDDIAADRAIEAVAYWHCDQNPVSELASVTCRIIGLERTPKGLLMLKLKTSEEVVRKREELALALQEFRSGVEELERHGVKHWSGFPHLTIGENVTPEQLDEVFEKLRQSEIIGQDIILGAPIMYPLHHQWGAEVTIEIL